MRANNDGKSRSGTSVDLLRKLPPQNLEAEQAVLGGVFQSNNTLHSLLDIITTEDFYSPAHKLIFQAFIDLYEKNIPQDLITVGNQLQTQGVIDEMGGPVYLAELADSVVSAANAVRHARIVRDKAILRSLIDASSSIIENCYESGDVDELLDQSEREIFSIADAKSTTTIFPSKDLVADVFSDLEARFDNKSPVTGIQTHYEEFDKMTAGLQKSDLIIVAGRPSMGKTAFALNIAMRAATRSDAATAVFSLEMSKEQLMTRMLGCQGKVSLKGLRTGYVEDGDWPKLQDAAHKLSQASLFIDDTPSLSTLELRARCRRLKSEHNLGLVVVDYLQLMRSSRKIDSREQEISDISRNLKALAKELNIPVMALSQLNRRVEERNPPKPMLSDLRESGAIEQDADVIVFLYREDYYRKLKYRKGGGEDDENPNLQLDNTATVIIGKQRNGPTGELDLRFLSDYTAFENLTEIPEPSEYQSI